jgi:CheY-like chemotaxis protein
MSRKILLADDSITIQKVVELTFSEGDFDVTSVGNGDLALRKARELKPDIALLDVIMPEKNGYEVCQLLKQDPELKRMPVLLLTGTFESFDHQRAEAAGADGYLTKPFESQMLISKVEELLASAPRRVTPLEQAGRMEIFTEGKVMNVEAPAQPQAPPEAAAAVPSPPTPEPPPASAPVRESWMGEPEPMEVSFPGPPSQPAPEAMAAFQEWSGSLPSAAARQPAAPQPPPAGVFADDEDSGPPSASPQASPASGSKPTFAREVPEPPAAGDASWGEAGSPSAPDQYEQTFELQQGTETVSLAGPPTPDLQPGTLYAGAEPAAAPAALTPELIDQIARRVVERLSDQVIREVAWEVIPDLAELLIKQRISDLERGGEPRG